MLALENVSVTVSTQPTISAKSSQRLCLRVVLRNLGGRSKF